MSEIVQQDCFYATEDGGEWSCDIIEKRIRKAFWERLLMEAIYCPSEGWNPEKVMEWLKKPVCGDSSACPFYSPRLPLL